MLKQSLFAMPMFDWNAPVDKTMSDRFWIYWAVTIPLTVVVVVCWIFWANRQELMRLLSARMTVVNEKQEGLRSAMSHRFDDKKNAIQPEV